MAHILIIDDEESIRDLLQLFLNSKGFSTAVAANGRIGLQRFDEKPPDLLITDLLMPDMDGMEVLIQMRKRCQKLPIIAMSGGMSNSEINLLPMAARLGACRTLEKPIDLNELLQIIETLLQSASAEKPKTSSTP